MSRIQGSGLGICGLLLGMVFVLGGCAGDPPAAPAGLEKKIETARTRADHQEIAAVYAQQAEGYKSAAQRHRDLAAAYKRGFVVGGPRDIGAPRGDAMAAHCENLARIYEQAAGENLALAREHRQLAAEMKD